MNYLTPIICSFLFWAGGRNQWKWLPLNQKILRKVGIGLFIGLAFKVSFILLCLTIAAYLIPYAFPYGEKGWIKQKDLRWITFGLVFGLASLPILGYFSLFQSIVGGCSFWALMKWSNDGFGGHKLSHQYVEFLFGGLGTIMYIFK